MIELLPTFCRCNVASWVAEEALFLNNRRPDRNLHYDIDAAASIKSSQPPYALFAYHPEAMSPTGNTKKVLL